MTNTLHAEDCNGIHESGRYSCPEEKEFQENKTKQKSINELFEEFAGLSVNYWRASGTSEEHKETTKEMQRCISQITQAIQRETILDIMNVIKETQESYLVQNQHPEQSNIINTSISSRNMTLRTVTDNIKNFAKDKDIKL